MEMENNTSSEQQGKRQNDSQKGTSNRGFASMSPEKQREIASKGGRAAHEQGVAHQWSSDEAKKAGRKGGESVSQNRQHMAEIGRKGGQSSRGGNKSNTQNNEKGQTTQSERSSSEDYRSASEGNREDSGMRENE